MKPIYYVPILLAMLIIAATLPVMSQTKVFEYTYDASGNRIKRELIQLKSAAITGEESLSEQQEILKDELNGHEIKIYPNPTKGMITVSISGWDNGSIQLLVYNLSGSLITETKVTGSENKIDLSQQPSGMYLMKIMAGEFSTDWKIVKE